MAKLITTLDEIQQFVKVSNGLSLQSLEPALNEVETDVLEHYLGADLLAEIVAQYDAVKANPDTASYTPRIAAIFPAVQRALASLGVYQATNEIEVQVNENGILRNENDREKTAFGGQIARFKETIANRGWASIDRMLQVLEEREIDYPEWLNAAYYIEKETILFPNASEFHKYENIKRSPLTFRAFFSYLRDLQEMRIGQALPVAMYQELREQYEADQLSADNKYILQQYIRPALAKFCMYQALQELPVEVDHEGVTVKQLELSGADSRTRTVATNQFIERKMGQLEGKGSFYMYKLSEYLNEQASSIKYPLWFNSDFYDEPLSKKIADNSLTNDQRNIFRA
jgi:hypothetical protein